MNYFLISLKKHNFFKLQKQKVNSRLDQPISKKVSFKESIVDTTEINSSLTSPRDNRNVARNKPYRVVDQITKKRPNSNYRLQTYLQTYFSSNLQQPSDNYTANNLTDDDESLPSTFAPQLQSSPMFSNQHPFTSMTNATLTNIFG